MGARFRHKHIKMSLHNLWLRRLLSSSHFRDPLPTPADMLNIEWGQNFCLEPLLSLSTSNTCIGSAIFSLLHASAHKQQPRCIAMIVLASHRLSDSNELRRTVQGFGSRLRAAHSFQLHSCQVTYAVLLLLGQSFSNSLIQNHLILVQGQIGNPSLASLPDRIHRAVTALLCLTLFCVLLCISRVPGGSFELSVAINCATYL